MTVLAPARLAHDQGDVDHGPRPESQHRPVGSADAVDHLDAHGDGGRVAGVRQRQGIGNEGHEAALRVSGGRAAIVQQPGVGVGRCAAGDRCRDDKGPAHEEGAAIGGGNDGNVGHEAVYGAVGVAAKIDLVAVDQRHGVGEEPHGRQAQLVLGGVGDVVHQIGSSGGDDGAGIDGLEVLKGDR